MFAKPTAIAPIRSSLLDGSRLSHVEIATPRCCRAIANRACQFSLLVALFFSAVGCAPDTSVFVYVDNGTKDTMVVNLDGTEVARIEPGQFKGVKTEAGDRHFRVQVGDKVLFDETKNFAISDRFGFGRTFLFNPDKQNRYATYKERYGNTELSSGLAKLFVAAVEAEAGKPQEQLTELQKAYKELLAEVKLVPPDPWFEIIGVQHVLTSPPATVVTRHGSDIRTVLTRVDPKDYASLQSARENKNPSEDDYDALFDIVERVLDSQR